MAGKSSSSTAVAGKKELLNPACTVPPVPVRELPDATDPNRVFLIRRNDKKWVNHTVLHYAFLDKPTSWRGAATQKQAVRDAFAEWKALGIGLSFNEVKRPEDAEIRIGFLNNGRSWSAVGRDAIDHFSDPQERTINFGWSVTTPYGRDTALHEIGHALGFPHEHQNPNAGIVWDEDVVIAHFGGPPNGWDESMVRHNILNKVSKSSVEGSGWDKNSIMHYQFDAGLILQPERYKTEPLIPLPGLSQTDIGEVRKFYPAPTGPRFPELRPWESQRVHIGAGEQLDFLIKPAYNREYTVQTFGAMDSVLVLFEEIDGEPRYYAGDDDSGSRHNARIRARLFKGRRYFLRLRLYHARTAGEGALLMY